MFNEKKKLHQLPMLCVSILLLLSIEDRVPAKQHSQFLYLLVHLSQQRENRRTRFWQKKLA